MLSIVGGLALFALGAGPAPEVRVRSIYVDMQANYTWDSTNPSNIIETLTISTPKTLSWVR